MLDLIIIIGIVTLGRLMYLHGLREERKIREEAFKEEKERIILLFSMFRTKVSKLDVSDKLREDIFSDLYIGIYLARDILDLHKIERDINFWTVVLPGTRETGKTHLSEKDLKTLELPIDTVSFDTIKKQYRILAKKYHPDVNPDGADRFKDISQAFNSLRSSF